MLRGSFFCKFNSPLSVFSVLQFLTNLLIASRKNQGFEFPGPVLPKQRLALAHIFQQFTENSGLLNGVLALN